MGTESYGGSCPKCTKALMQKHETGSGWLQFDACVWCGFAFGERGFQEEMTETQVWDALFEHNHVDSREDLIKQLDLTEFVSEQESEIWPSVFVYPEHKALERVTYHPMDGFNDFVSGEHPKN